MKTEVFWGLSNSSSNLAKQLLPSSHLNRSNSENVFQMCTTQMQLEECQGENNTEQDTCSADATCSQVRHAQCYSSVIEYVIGMYTYDLLFFSQLEARLSSGATDRCTRKEASSTPVEDSR